MMHRKYTYTSYNLGKRQQGTTLLVAIILLFSITMVSLFSAKVGLIEQRTSANEYRAIQSMHTADSGIERVLAALNDTTERTVLLTDSDADGNLSDETATNFIADTSGDLTYKAIVSNPTNGDFTTLNITSYGCSDSCSNCNSNCPSYKNVTQQIKLITALYDTPVAPLTVMSDITITGSVSVTNSISSGGETVLAAGGTITGHPSTQLYDGTGGPYNSTDPEWAAPLVSPADTNVKTNSDDFFEAVFGESKSVFEAIAETFTCTNSPTCTAALTTAAGNSQLIWANSDLILNGNGTYGTVANPVILIINGAPNFGGNITINGIIYIIGNVNCGGCGNLTVNGAFLAEGTFTANANPTVVFQQQIFQNLMNQPMLLAKVGGSWTDP